MNREIRLTTARVWQSYEGRILHVYSKVVSTFEFCSKAAMGWENSESAILDGFVGKPHLSGLREGCP